MNGYKAWDTRRLRYGPSGLTPEKLEVAQRQMKIVQRQSPTAQKGKTYSPETRAKIAESVKRAWAAGSLEKSRATCFENGRNQALRAQHDAMVRDLIAVLRAEGHTVVYADIRGFWRPDIITIKDGKAYVYDQKTNGTVETSEIVEEQGG